MASASLAKFSDLLRHQLYECNDQLIPLSKELRYLTNYIELEKLRQGSRVRVDTEISDSFIGHLAVAPFILMTFVENAFKHVAGDAQGQHWISIKVRITDMTLNLTVANSIVGLPSKDTQKSGGIGLNNVKRRLDLVYGNHHSLNISDQSDKFEVMLELKLSELAHEELHHTFKTVNA